MNHVIEKMYYNNREVVLQERTTGSFEEDKLCDGCVLEHENDCSRKIVPAQSTYVCCPRHTGVLYIFKCKEE